MIRRIRRFLVRSWPLLAAIAILVGLPLLLRQNRYGRVFVDATLYLPDVMVRVPLPYRPIELLSEAPSRERITISYESRDGPRTIEADLYVPQGNGPFSAEVFSMGAPPLDLDSKRLVRIAEDSARSGVVMLVPFSERLDDERIEPEEIDALVAEFQYVQALPYVKKDSVGFFGASVGGSLALVAAADSRIAPDVAHVVSFGGYYDALDTFGAIATEHIRYGDVDEEWDARRHAERVMAKQFIYELEDPRDRELLTRLFLDRDEVPSEELVTLTPVGRGSYDFLANDDAAAVQDFIDRLPESMREKLEYLSPRTSIDNVTAELFIVHDRADPFIPYTESRRLEDALEGRDDIEAHFEEIRLFEHVEPKLNQRPEVIAFDSTRVLFRLYQLMLRWD
jgi:pimeloyl-ACP methyl ester carboxylesterase